MKSPGSSSEIKHRAMSLCPPWQSFGLFLVLSRGLMFFQAKEGWALLEQWWVEAPSRCFVPQGQVGSLPQPNWDPMTC